MATGDIETHSDRPRYLWGIEHGYSPREELDASISAQDKFFQYTLYAHMCATLEDSSVALIYA